MRGVSSIRERERRRHRFPRCRFALFAAVGRSHAPAWFPLLAFACFLSGCGDQDAESETVVRSPARPVPAPVQTFPGADTKAAVNPQTITPMAPGPGLGEDSTGPEARDFTELDEAQEAALQSLIEQYRGDKEGRSEVLDRIDSDFYGVEILPFLEEVINGDDEELSGQAIDMLAGNTSAQIIPVLEPALGSPVTENRLAAVRAVGQVRDDALVDFLGKVFENDDPDVRVSGFDALQDQPKERKLDIYDRALESSSDEVGVGAVGLLELESGRRSVDLLIEALDAPNPNVRDEAAFSLEFQFDRRFSDSGEARTWWSANRDRYDEDLMLKEPES